MNAKQRRTRERQVWRDHFLWPLGTLVQVLPGHHSPKAVGMFAKIGKHGYPCTHLKNCIVDFPIPVFDTEYGAARYGHYADFKHLKRVKALK